MRTQALRLRASILGIVGAGLLAACNNQYPTTPPDPNQPMTWAQQHHIDKMRYQQAIRDGSID